MTRSSVGSHQARTTPPRRSIGTSAFAAAACLSLVVAACGGDDDDDAGASTSSSVATEVTATFPTTTVAAAVTTTTTPATTLPPLDLVTDGATLVVANASGIDGAAGRMTDVLAVAGFSTGTATNSTESQLETTKIYYDPENAAAKAVADSVRLALGGGDIEVLELSVPAPVSEPDALGDATIVVAMGNDTADKSLDELQGRVPPADESTEESGDDSTGDETTDETTADETTDEGTGDG